jgi:hypothetical protein
MGLFSAGMLIGTAVAGLRPEPAVSAQGSWQCRSWALESKEGADVVGPWLGGAAHVEISTASLANSGRYALVACKR